MFSSTRSNIIDVSAKQAILKGLADDGGLFVNPNLGDTNLRLKSDEYIGNPYLQTAKSVFKKFLHDFTDEEIESCITSAYKGTFENDEIAPLKKVGNVFVCELYHGPTSAFKDVALTILPQFLSTALKETKQKALILTATSGDTGKAAMSGFADVENTAICVYYPHGGVSEVQYRQMATQTGSNVNVFAIEGNFDDAQRNVKSLFADESLNKVAHDNSIVLTSANSINIGRLIPQIVYYFSSYSKLVEMNEINVGDEIIFSVPTGNFGDILAGYCAKEMGLPISKLICASNKNDVLDIFIKTGIYDTNRPFYKTISPSMDILISSNLERLLYYASNKNVDKVNAWMNDLKKTGRYEVDDKTLSKIKQVFDSGTASEEETKETIKEVFEKHNYVLDTHSAIAFSLAEKCAVEGQKVVSLATASPYKFPRSVMSAILDKDNDEWSSLANLEKISEQKIPSQLNEINKKEILHNDVIEISEMKKTVKNAILKLAN